MQSKKNGQFIVLRLEKGEKVIESLETFATKENLAFSSVSMIGSLEDITLAWLGPDGVIKDTLKERHEFSANGNISLMKGKHLAHIHAWCGDSEKNAKVGHLVEGKVAVTCEIVLTVTGQSTSRKHDKNIDYYVLDL